VSESLFPIVVAVVGLVTGIPSYITWSRRWPGMIAGFDQARCSDVDGLTRWVGGTGMVLSAACLLAAAVAYVAPRFLGGVSVVFAIILLVGCGVTMSGCARYTRR
jgi:hypothetical protein